MRLVLLEKWSSKLTGGINDSVTSIWRFSFVMLMLTQLLSACVNRGPIGSANFDPSFSSILDEQQGILLYAKSELRLGTFMEAEIKMVPSYDGVLVLTQNQVYFLVWKASESSYRAALTFPYIDVVNVKYQFNTLIQSYVAVKTRHGEAFTFMLPDQFIEPTYQTLSQHLFRHR